MTAPAPSNRSRGTSRRRRRTKAEIEKIKDHIYDVASHDHPVTIRQVFYRLVSRGLIEKSENEYSSTVSRLCAEMRRSGGLRWSWIADNTRWMRKPRTFDSLVDALETTARTYRRSLWTTGDYVEIWLEKEALSGVLYAVTEAWDVPLMVTRGYPSLTFLYSAAEDFPTDRRTYIYYFGDHDPSGVDIARHTEEQLREFYVSRAFGAGDEAREFERRILEREVGLHFDRVAVTRGQIAELDLPTRPTKKTDSRSKEWEGGSVEVDAIPPQALRELCEDCIRRHVDARQLEVLQATEAAERKLLEAIADAGKGA